MNIDIILKLNDIILFNIELILIKDAIYRKRGMHKSLLPNVPIYIHNSTC